MYNKTFFYQSNCDITKLFRLLYILFTLKSHLYVNDLSKT